MFSLYGLDSPSDLSEIHLRPVGPMLDRLLAKCDWPLARPRPPAKRLIGSCRHYSVLLCSILRAAGEPSRVRCGFACYFDPVHWEDHWITEVWNARATRWQRVDAEIDSILQSAFSIGFDPIDIPDRLFLSGPDAWRRYRDGDIDADLFGIGSNRGPRFIAGSVVRDLAALNKVEMLPWDYWGYIRDLDQRRMDLDVGLIDAVADAVAEGSWAERTAAYRQPGIAVPADLRRVVADR